MKKLTVLFAVFLLAVSAVSVSAQETEVKTTTCKPVPLDSETKVKFEKIKLQYELDMVDLKAEKETLHKELMAELLKEDTSRKSIDKIAKAMNTNQGKMLSAKMDYLLKIKGVLPADHYKAFISKGHGMKGHGMKGQGMMGQGRAPGCKSSCSTKGASKCSKAGTAGHTCTSACVTGSDGCKTPCKVTK